MMSPAATGAHWHAYNYYNTLIKVENQTASGLQTLHLVLQLSNEPLKYNNNDNKLMLNIKFELTA
jgi:hypothetical protein